MPGPAAARQASISSPTRPTSPSSRAPMGATTSTSSRTGGDGGGGLLGRRREVVAAVRKVRDRGQAHGLPAEHGPAQPAQPRHRCRPRRCHASTARAHSCLDLGRGLAALEAGEVDQADGARGSVRRRPARRGRLRSGCAGQARPRAISGRAASSRSPTRPTARRRLGQGLGMGQRFRRHPGGEVGHDRDARQPRARRAGR